MLRAKRWITALTAGWALACVALSLEAQSVAKENDAAAAPKSKSSTSSKPVDYVVEIPAEDESDDYYQQDIPGQYTAGDDAAQPLDAAGTEQEEPELIKERFPQRRDRISSGR